MPVNWTPEIELKLLLVIIENMGGKPASWPTVAATMGYGFTTESVRQHFAALKKQNEAFSGKPLSPTNGSAKPLKRKRSEMKVDSFDDGASTGKPLKSTNDSTRPRKRKFIVIKSEIPDDANTSSKGKSIRRRLFTKPSNESPEDTEEFIKEPVDEDPEV